MTNLKALRAMLIALLDDSNGICSAGYDSLRGYVSSLGLEVDNACGDIWLAVESGEGYYYLPENHGLA